MTDAQGKTKLGLFGFGSFGRFIAPYVMEHFEICAYDPSPESMARGRENGFNMVSLQEAAACPIVVIGVPVPVMRDAVKELAPHLQEGTLVLDIASVKYEPAQIMDELLPAHVQIVATHPLFGPQSGKNGIQGFKIAVCPVRDPAPAAKVAAFLRDKMKLHVIDATPEEHDRELAYVQGITHLMARTFLKMEPLPTKMTTVSYEHMVEAVYTTRDVSTELFFAIVRNNPFAREARERFVGQLRAICDAIDAGATEL